MEPRDDAWQTDVRPPVQYPPEAYDPPPLHEPKKKSSKVGLIVVLVVVGVGVLGGVCFWGWGLFRDQARDALNRNRVIQRHIGRITKMELNFTETGEDPDPEVLVFDITGTKGSGTVTARFVTTGAESEEVESGTLRLSSGKTYDLNGNDDFDWDSRFEEREDRY